MKILVLDCSPKATGNTAYLINTFLENTNAEVTRIKLFPSFTSDKGVMPCIDCGGCHKCLGCVINDEFRLITKDVYDVVLIASPIYMSNLPGPLFNVISRFNYIFNNKQHLNIEHKYKSKRAILFLIGGGNACNKLKGESNEDLPIRQSKYIFGKLNADLVEDDMVLCLNTDSEPLLENKAVINKVIDIAKSCK